MGPLDQREPTSGVGFCSTWTWTTVDDFQGTPWAITTDANGNVFVSGSTSDAAGISHLITRELTP